ncbi:coordinator of PRMT5 and differentiation stimulator isoform X4 [Cyanistes caeruleus]|uniref:coordinator of PRMT5 and differentiation stimulator isoform X4 n=1 Tax=Cyanistes caeruleus TaxID=156563 RepID=UPI000CDB916E|nr:coordinator of PRMT5 and differentiation stimulator isoform X4 [Cyanistes caeruleus]
MVDSVLVMAAASEEKLLPNKTEIVVWKPRKECLQQNIPNVPDGKSEESESASTSPSEGDVSGSTDEGWYNIYADLDVWDNEVSSIPESSGQQDASEHEVEDWDRELEEFTCGPYDADDLSCGSFEENNLSSSSLSVII